jgi:lysophospholipase L1-like esterase
VRRLGVVAWVEKRERGTLQCPAPGSPPARGLRWVAALLLFCIGLVHANEPFESEIAAFDAQPAQPGAVVFIGSSSIRLWNTLATDFPDVPVLNRGFGGSELRHATYSAERILARHAPRAVVLYSGDNDLAAGRTPQQVAADFAAFVDTVQALPTHPRIAVIAIKPSPARAALLLAQREANAGLARVARAHPSVDFIDVFSPMLDADGAPRPELFVEDGLHMAPAGYALWRREIAPFLRDRP